MRGLFRFPSYVLIGLTIVVSARQSFAQAQAPQPVLPSNSQVVTRPMYVEGAVVVGLMGAAVFAVCRSSRRV